MDEIRVNRARELMNGISPSFCLAKWLQTTLYLQNGYNHSCHHPSPHKIPLIEIEEDPSALHNTQYKKKQMQMMIDGERPPECEYCWKIEDLGKEYFSDRHYKSSTAWAQPNIGEVLEVGTENINPRYLEISFSNTCNFKCVYCSPEISSTWYKEIQKHGGYPTSNNHNSFSGLEANNKLPYDPNGENPYVDAFWKWWPELYPELHTLRLTGGEPLMSKDVWQIIDFLIENPNLDLTFAINTNLCVQDKLIDKFITKMNLLIDNVKEIQVFSSGEAVGEQAEYVRFGLDYKKWVNNMHRVANETTGNLILANMTTVNLLSAPTFCEFIEFILDLREKYNPLNTHNKIQFMINYLRYPGMLSLPNLDNIRKELLNDDILNLIERRGSNYDGVGKLSLLEIDQLNRMIDYVFSEEPSDLNRSDFVNYVDELDVRRDTKFNTVFPELMEYYYICQTNI